MPVNQTSWRNVVGQRSSYFQVNMPGKTPCALKTTAMSSSGSQCWSKRPPRRLPTPIFTWPFQTTWKWQKSFKVVIRVSLQQCSCTAAVLWTSICMNSKKTNMLISLVNTHLKNIVVLTKPSISFTFRGYRRRQWRRDLGWVARIWRRGCFRNQQGLWSFLNRDVWESIHGKLRPKLITT